MVYALLLNCFSRFGYSKTSGSGQTYLCETDYFLFSTKICAKRENDCHNSDKSQYPGRFRNLQS